MGSFLLSILPDFLKVYLGIKVDTAERLGEAEQRAFDANEIAKALIREQQAAENAPDTKKTLISTIGAGKLTIALLVLTQLTGCAQNVSSVYPSTCLPIKEWSAEDQKAVGTLLDMLSDYKKMRDESRACSDGG